MAVTVVELIQLRDRAGSWDALFEQMRLVRAADDLGNGGKASNGKKMTELEMAVVTMRKAGKVVHSKTIAEMILAEYDVKVDPHSLGSQLHRRAKKKRDFFKDPRHKNSYGLLEWQQRLTS